MTNKLSFFICAVVFLAGFFWGMPTYAQSTQADDLKGLWQNEDHTRQLEFIKVDKAFDAVVKKADNEEAVGKKLVTGLTYDGKQYTGKVYAPKRNKWYPCTIVLKDKNTLELTVKAGWITQTKEWSRVGS